MNFVVYCKVTVQLNLHSGLWKYTMVFDSVHSFSYSELLAPVQIPLKCQNKIKNHLYINFIYKAELLLANSCRRTLDMPTKTLLIALLRIPYALLHALKRLSYLYS